MYPLDRRTVALRLYAILKSLRKTASFLDIHYSTVSRWSKNPIKKQYTRQVRDTLKSTMVVESIRLGIENDPFISIRYLQQKAKEVLNVTVSRELVRIAIKRLGLSKKKAKFHGCPKTLPEKTREFLETRQRFIDEGRDFVSMDETSFGRNWPDKKGYAPRGKPLYIVKKQATVKTVSVLACASKKGWVGTMKKFDSFNTESFMTFIESLNLSQGTVVLLDNVSFHHSKVVKALFATKGLIALYTPPYSPWFNPIELCFSIVKRTFATDQDIDASFASLNEHHFNAFFKKSLGCEDKY
jgi:transposase